MPSRSDPDRLLAQLDLGEYEATALENLLSIGRTTAPDLSEATGIPKARIYGVLEDLAERGFVKIIPGRPKEYEPKPPAEILDAAVETERQAFEAFEREIENDREAFLAEFRPRYEQASQETTPTEELFHVVDVGEPSERETRALYHEATEQVCVLTKSFEYFESVAPAFADAVDRGVTVSVLFLHPRHLSADNRDVQAERIATLREEFPGVAFRFSEERLPWRGTLMDPSMDYETGKAIVLVEEKEVPLHMRQAAITENGSFVAGLKRYFDLIWEHESAETV